MDCGFFIAEKLPDGSPGRPVGDQEYDTVALFHTVEKAIQIRDSVNKDLKIFRLNLVFVGEVTEC
jgi:hypothetical protein